MSFLCCCATKLEKGDERKIDGKYYKRPVRIGNSYLLCGKKNSAFPYHLFVGPEWPCMIITNVLIIVPTYFFITGIATDMGIGMVIGVCCTAVLLLVMFAATACSDPGIVFIPGSEGEVEGTQAKSPEEKMEGGIMSYKDKSASTAAPSVPMIQCGQCCMDRPRTASHCYECGLCVDHLDHHCPWTGKCIAKKNLDRFHYFLYSLCLHMAVVIITTIYHVTNPE
jgi:palmitoyltransferase ZDHHC9/14/18